MMLDDANDEVSRYDMNDDIIHHDNDDINEDEDYDNDNEDNNELRNVIMDQNKTSIEKKH